MSRLFSPAVTSSNTSVSRAVIRRRVPPIRLLGIEQLSAAGDELLEAVHGKGNRLAVCSHRSGSPQRSERADSAAPQPGEWPQGPENVRVGVRLQGQLGRPARIITTNDDRFGVAEDPAVGEKLGRSPPGRACSRAGSALSSAA